MSYILIIDIAFHSPSLIYLNCILLLHFFPTFDGHLPLWIVSNANKLQFIVHTKLSFIKVLPRSVYLNLSTSQRYICILHVHTKGSPKEFIAIIIKMCIIVFYFSIVIRILYIGINVCIGGFVVPR